MGCDLVSFDLPDSSLRFENDGREYELSPPDDSIYTEVKRRLEDVLGPALHRKAAIYVPLGVSHHLDHLLVRDAVQAIGRRDLKDKSERNIFFYYKDLPYGVKMTDSEIRHFAQQAVSLSVESLVVDLDHKWSAKKRAVELYATQIEACTIPYINKHALRVGKGARRAERIWYAPPPIAARQPVVDTICWISWEACRLLGGCGVVLSAIIDDPHYQAVVERTLLMGPMYMPRDCFEYDPGEDAEDLGAKLASTILYRTHQDSHHSSLHGFLVSRLREIEAKHGLELVYMRDNRNDDQIVERLLFNFSSVILSERIHSPSLSNFLELLRHDLGLELPVDLIRQRTSLQSAKFSLSSIQGHHPLDNMDYNLKEKARIDSDAANWKHEDDDYTYGILMAQPVAEATRALLERGESCLLIVQEYLSLPTAYASMLGPRNDSFKTLYYVGEVRPICSLVEGGIEPRPLEAGIPGGNFAWDAPIQTLINITSRNYRSLDLPEMKVFLDFDPFLPLQNVGSLVILGLGWKLDRVLPICPSLLDELVFLNEEFAVKKKGNPACFYHGVRMIQNSIGQKTDCKRRLLAYAARCWGTDIDTCRDRDCIIMLRVARPVTAKAMHRDLAVAEQLGLLLPKKKILLIVITFWREGTDNRVIQMLLSKMALVNNAKTNVYVRIVNGFQWPQLSEKGNPETYMTRDDIHRAVDVNLCLSSYDSYNLAAMEGLSCGTLCVISTSCGAAKRVKELPWYDRNIVLVDYINIVTETVLAAKDKVSLNELALSLFKISVQERVQIEAAVAVETAHRIRDALPEDAYHRVSMIEWGTQLAQQMSWDSEIKNGLVPVLKKMFGVQNLDGANGVATKNS